MFGQLTAPSPSSFGGRAIRTARLIKAFATLDDRPLDELGRPLDFDYDDSLEPWEQIYAGQRPVAMVPMHRRRNDTPTVAEDCPQAPAVDVPATRSRLQH